VTRTSWQTLLADLALVLFMVTVGALVRARREHAPVYAAAAPVSQPIAAPQESTPLSVYRDVAGAPPLAAWLRQPPRDTRQQTTIVVTYRPGTERALPGRIAAVIAAASASGPQPRIVIEPGEGGVSAGIGFDTAPMARDLLSPDDTFQHRTTP
jgi:hypothetical protein